MTIAEAAYAKILDAELRAGAIVRWQYKPLRLRLADDWAESWAPDFQIDHVDGSIELVDVRGEGDWCDAVRAKILRAAIAHPSFTFAGARRVGKSFERVALAP